MVALAARWQPPITPSDTQNQNNNQPASFEFYINEQVAP